MFRYDEKAIKIMHEVTTSLNKFFGIRSMWADAAVNNVKKFGTVEDLEDAQHESLYWFCYEVMCLCEHVFKESPHTKFPYTESQKSRNVANAFIIECINEVTSSDGYEQQEAILKLKEAGRKFELASLGFIKWEEVVK